MYLKLTCIVMGIMCSTTLNAETRSSPRGGSTQPQELPSSFNAVKAVGNKTNGDAEVLQMDTKGNTLSNVVILSPAALDQIKKACKE